MQKHALFAVAPHLRLQQKAWTPDEDTELSACLIQADQLGVVGIFSHQARACWNDRSYRQMPLVSRLDGERPVTLEDLVRSNASFSVRITQSKLC